MPDSPIWLSEAEVVSLIDMGEAIESVSAVFADEAIGAARNMLKTHLPLDHGSVHSLGGALTARDIVGVKSWVHSPVTANPLLTLWRISDGALVAVIEAFALGQYRTAAVAGSATRALSRPDSRRMTILGTGRQALAQVGAVVAVRPISHVTVWSPNPAHRETFAQEVTNALGVSAVAADTVEHACDGADVITIATRATAPFLSADVVGRGTHINALGAITPERAEFEPTLLSRCSIVACDSIAATRRLSHEFMDHYGDDDQVWSSVTSIASVVASAPPRAADDITLFKAMGVGIADVAIGSFVYEQALVNRIGLPLALPEPSRPRLRSSLARPGAAHL